MMIFAFLNMSIEYKDDTHIIPRSSLVIAKRIPASKAGKGKGAIYLAGTMPAASSSTDGPMGKEKSFSAPPVRTRGAMSKRFDGKDDVFKNRASVCPACTVLHLSPELSICFEDPDSQLLGF